MRTPEKVESLIKNLPDAESARRFYSQLSEKFPFEAGKLNKNDALLSDILTLAAFSPLLATTLLQNPDYIRWLDRQRASAKVRGKEEILESLARFALTNSQLDQNVLLARFRRRELLRIYLRDIRGLGTIAEITEEISNLADAILEYALQLSRQELDNRYGIPLENDEKERAAQASFCIVALGKLGSKELNYASDIDLLFLYSNEGATSGQGSRGAVSNREYFVKLAEFVTKLVGGQSGEGAAYRVDSRLRPHGRVGALAVSLAEAAKYYINSAQPWERQVLIRSRASAGERKLFRKFFDNVKTSVFSMNETPENALRNVRLSKEKINLEKSFEKNYNVKLGKGGIREIEFIAQALQLAYGGRDEWLRASHTLISLSRLADRNLLAETELTELFDAYDFLRRAEHRLQMENGLQTHLVPLEPERRLRLAKRMYCDDLEDFDVTLKLQSSNVSRVFERIFGNKERENTFVEKFFAPVRPIETPFNDKPASESPKVYENDKRFYKTRNLPHQVLSSLEKSDIEIDLRDEIIETLVVLSEISPHHVEMIAANPYLIVDLPNANEDFSESNYRRIYAGAIRDTSDFAEELAVLRKIWSRFLLEIVVSDAFEKITPIKARSEQTKLAEASIETALVITRRELERRFSRSGEDFPFAVLGLGKLGGGGMDYNSDLDLILVYDETLNSESQILIPEKIGVGQNFSDRKHLGIQNLNSEMFYSRAVEIFVTTLSSLTREGQLYRVDLRLRPDGKNGASSIGKNSFLNYLHNRSAIWEWLAYVKIRGVAGDLSLAKSTETEARRIIHENALLIYAESLRTETKRVRERLEEEKAGRRKSREIDIKFGAGGMLDVYFAARFLQLRDNVPDEAENRSTVYTLEKLYKNGSLSGEDFQNFFNGYKFLSELDHNLRLTVGRSTRLPVANQNALRTIVKRMNLASIKDLMEELTFHRLNTRVSFENVFKT